MDPAVDDKVVIFTGGAKGIKARVARRGSKGSSRSSSIAMRRRRVG